MNIEVELAVHDRDVEIAKLRQALKEIAARARFELDHPTQLRDTAFSLIERTAIEAL